MKVTIAGANSFIGKRMIAYAESQEDIELTLVIKKSSFIDLTNCTKSIKVYKCDMNDYNNLGRLVGKGDCFINLSWYGSRGAERQNSEIQRFNYESNMAAMKSIAVAGYNTLITAGSQAEYGQCSGFISESTPLNANTEYGKYKVQVFYETAKLCKENGRRFLEPRFFSLYGPGDYPKTLIMSCIDKMLRNVPCELNDCTQIWDYLYVDDAVEGVFSLCRNDKAFGAYNFATGNYRMIREFVMDIHKVLKSESRVQFGSPKNTFDGLIIDLQPLINKLCTDANWTPRTSFVDGIKKTVASFKKS